MTTFLRNAWFNSKVDKIDFIFRVIADLIMLEMSFFGAIIIHLAFLSTTSKLHYHFNLITFMLPPLICLPIHYLSGFYTYGRSYQSRFKALIVVQSISLGFLILSSIAFFVPIFFSLPKAVLISAYFLNLSAMLFARLWSSVWRWVSKKAGERGIDSKRTNAILVIGGAGYIGSGLLKKLLHAGYQVRLLDLFLYGEEPIQEVINHPNLSIHRGDFRQVDTLVEAIRGVSSVIHLGGIVGDPACALDEELTIQVNLTATRTIAEIAKGFGVDRFIFVSSCSVYGASDQILNENSQLNPVSLYAKSKIASERVLKQMADSSFSPTILRFGTIFGLSGRTRFDLVVNLMTACAVTEKCIRVFGGDQWRPFLHVDDAAASVFAALQAPKALVANQVFNVGDNAANMTLHTVAQKIQALLPGTEIHLAEPDGDRRNYRVDFTKINRILGFKTRVELNYGIEQVIEAIRSGNVTNFRDPKYSNVMFLKMSPDVLKKLDPTGAITRLLSPNFDDTDEKNLYPQTQAR